MKNSRLAASGGNRMDLEFPQKLCPHRTVWQLTEKLHSQGFSLFDMTQNSLCANRPIHRAFVKNNQWQLFNIAVA